MKKLLILLVLSCLVIGIIFVARTITTSRTTVYVGVLKEPIPRMFSSESDTRYIVPMVIKDYVTNKEVVKEFIIEEPSKQEGEMCHFIKENFGQRCFITTKKSSTPGYERIVELAIK